MSGEHNLTQRSDYTFKFNAQFGRHGWLRLTPAYSLKIVESILRAEPRSRILDPFSGTATTPLCAAYLGHSAVATEINPFLVWFGRVKTDRYDSSDVAEGRSAFQRISRAMSKTQTAAEELPPIHNIERWWPPDALQFLGRVKAELNKEKASRAKVLLEVAFCRTLIRLSNAAFNHQSMSFRAPSEQVDLFSSAGTVSGFCATLGHDFDFVANGALQNPTGSCEILEGDAARVCEIVKDKFDMVITSPPYPNRMSYIRELRPYMYWLGYLRNGRDAAEIDWSSIGGTWGVATSRLSSWRRSPDGYYPSYFEKIIESIEHDKNASGRLLANYVAKYFEDMWKHLRSLRGILASNARVHYVVGNSSFYGVLLPVERLYADMLSDLGFTDVEIRAVRKRNSKKELVEFDVSATYRPIP